MMKVEKSREEDDFTKLTSDSGWKHTLWKFDQDIFIVQLFLFADRKDVQ